MPQYPIFQHRAGSGAVFSCANWVFIRMAKVRNIAGSLDREGNVD